MNKTEQLYQELKSRIESGEFAIGSRFPSEYTLSEEYQVNKSTANQAVTLLENNGYVCRGVRGSGTRVLSHKIFPAGTLLFCAPFSIYNARILNGIQRAALNREYAVMVLFGNSSETRSTLEKMNRSQVKGIISTEPPVLPDSEKFFPFVAVDYDIMPDSPECSVNTDNRNGGSELMREILRRGHHEIVVLCGNQEAHERAERLQGFCETMRESGIKDIRKRVFHSDCTNISDTEAALKKILRIFPDTTIIVCDGDDTAQALLIAGRNSGVQIPGKIALTSYGNTLLTNISCASVEQHPEKIGALACVKLIDIIESEGIFSGVRRELVPPQVVNTDFIPDLNTTWNKSK